VVVQTAQGQVLRDVRLEELLAEHRQYGGMSALQMPAGFLRNATYDAAPQR
jgi:sigma-E factor negative regulatory protein RseA